MVNIESKSFRAQIHIILALLGIVPYLMVIYIFAREGLTASEIVLLVAAIILLFHLSGFYILRRFSDRLIRLTQDITHKNGRNRYEQLEVHDDSVVEIRTISNQFNQLLSELEESKKNFSDVTIALMKQARDASTDYQSKISESKTREERLKPYVGIDIFEQLIHNHGLEDIHLNSRREVSVLFADIRAFTTISETAEPEDVVSMLNEHFELMVEVIHRHNGVLDKFIGDELMAVFGLLPSSNKTAIDAVNAAIEMQATLQQLMEKRRREEKVTFGVGIGINSGTVIAGDIGSARRRDYTVIGDSVNVASRLVQIAAGDEILISRQTYNECSGQFTAEHKGKVQVKNRREEVEFYKVLAGII